MKTINNADHHDIYEINLDKYVVNCLQDMSVILLELSLPTTD